MGDGRPLCRHWRIAPCAAPLVLFLGNLHAVVVNERPTHAMQALSYDQSQGATFDTHGSHGSHDPSRQPRSEVRTGDVMPRAALQSLSHAVRALARLHSCGYAHRDVKPGNILRRPNHHDWTLIDFGCITTTGMNVIGTPASRAVRIPDPICPTSSRVADTPGRRLRSRTTCPRPPYAHRGRTPLLHMRHAPRTSYTVSATPSHACNAAGTGRSA